MLIPEDKFTPEVLEAGAKSLSKMFIKDCGKDSFFVKPNAQPFCKESIFSLTSDFNDGAWPCECHPRGSFSEQCKVFGGQCPCRPNVIGRKCTRCKTGYYGFPNCRSKYSYKIWRSVCAIGTVDKISNYHLEGPGYNPRPSRGLSFGWPSFATPSVDRDVKPMV